MNGIGTGGVLGQGLGMFALRRSEYLSFLLILKFPASKFHNKV